MQTPFTLTWLGHSAVQLVLETGEIILIDPFLSGNPSTPEELKQPTHVDYILLTHGHEDHVGDTIELANSFHAKVVSIVELSGLLKQDGLKPELAIEFNKGGTVSFDHFKVSMTTAHHSSSFGGRYAGDPAGLVITLANDFSIYHAGDTSLMGDFDIIKQLYEPNISFLPIGDHYTMGPKAAAIACEMLQTDIAIPIHFGTFPPLVGDPNEFKTLVEERCDTKVLLPTIGEIIQLG